MHEFVTAETTRNVQFTPRRLKVGYDEGEVDKYLSSVEHTLIAYEQFMYDVHAAVDDAPDKRSLVAKITAAYKKFGQTSSGSSA